MANPSRSRLIRRIAYVLVGLVILAFIVTRILAPKPGPEYVTAKVVTGDVQQTVALTGTTEPKTRYSLQFPKTGKIAQILVKVGDVVKSGDILAVLKNDDAQFQLESQKAALRFAQANYAKAIAAQPSQNIELSKLKIDLANLELQNATVSQQDTADSAEKALNSAYISVQMAQTALNQAQQQSDYTYQNVQMSTWEKPDYNVYDSGYYYGDLRSALPQPVAVTSTGNMSSTGAVSMPSQAPAQASASSYSSATPTGPSYLTNVNNIDTAQNAVEKAQEAYDQAQQAYDKATADVKGQADGLDNGVSKAEVDLKSAQTAYSLTVAKPRDVDVAPLKAQVDQAWQGVNLAQYQLDQTVLKAPEDGVIGSVASNPGENNVLGQSLITMDTNYLYIKALVSEADIAKIKVGQDTDITFDAFGSATALTGNVYEVDPAETIVQGVVYYTVKVQFDAQKMDVKPGMTANLTIKTNTKSNVLEVPARAVQYNGNQAYVQLLKTDNNKKQTVTQQNVTVGLQGDDNYEILSGVQVGDDVVTFTKSS